MTRDFHAWIGAGSHHPGLFVIRLRPAVGEIVDWLVLVWSASGAEEWQDRITYLPTR